MEPMTTQAIATVNRRPRAAARRHWSLDDIPWGSLDRDAVAQNDAVFYLVAASSLMESATDLYTQNLIAFFADDEEIASWLEDYWLPEELQHGRALRHYVEAAWPEFPWERVRAGFIDEFRPFCDQSLERARSLEMASRCVVEMGTASFYTGLSRSSPEPVLADVAGRIAKDEVRHYKHFYRFFRKYRATERPRRSAIGPALWRRLMMTGGEDRLIVLKHVYAARRPGVPFDKHAFRRIQRQARQLMRRSFPVEMSIRMLLKPLDLSPWVLRLCLPPMIAVARRLAP
jgi:hypothetical protein